MVSFVREIPVVHINFQTSSGSAADWRFEEFIPCRGQRLLDGLSLVHLVIVQSENAVRIRIAVPIRCWKICGIQDFNTEIAGVVEALACVKFHLDRDVAHRHGDGVCSALAILQRDLGWSVQATL